MCIYIYNVYICSIKNVFTLLDHVVVQQDVHHHPIESAWVGNKRWEWSGMLRSWTSRSWAALLSKSLCKLQVRHESTATGDSCYCVGVCSMHDVSSRPDYLQRALCQFRCTLMALQTLPVTQRVLGSTDGKVFRSNEATKPTKSIQQLLEFSRSFWGNVSPTHAKRLLPKKLYFPPYGSPFL